MEGATYSTECKEPQERSDDQSGGDSMGMAEGLVVAILGEGASAVSVLGVLNTPFDEVMSNSGHDASKYIPS